MAKAATTKGVNPPKVTKPYNYRSCASLFGYSAEVHIRSGGICALCGFGVGSGKDFDSWRQLTVEHIIGRKDGGYRDKIREAVAQRVFVPPLSPERQTELIEEVDRLNTRSACSFCNSVTSRAKCERSMRMLIVETPGGDSELLEAVIKATETELAKKRTDVQRKLESIKRAFNEEVAPQLANTTTTLTQGIQKGGILGGLIA